MKAELGTPFRIAGLARSPDREGALAHFDPDRGFALAARGSMGPADVVDPIVWVREKISVALAAASADPGDPPLRRVIGALRALHAELMSRPESDRPWVAVIILLLRGEDAVAISAGDCPCFRFRGGLLSRLGRMEADLGARAPRGALGSEPQVRIEVVPLRPLPGDLYILSTRALREGELAVLARDLTLARDGAQLLRAGADGASDRGRLAVRVLDPRESEAAILDAAAPSTGQAGAEPTDREDLGDWSDSLQIEPLDRDALGIGPAPLPGAGTGADVPGFEALDTHAAIEVPEANGVGVPLELEPALESGAAVPTGDPNAAGHGAEVLEPGPIAEPGQAATPEPAAELERAAEMDRAPETGRASEADRAFGAGPPERGPGSIERRRRELAPVADDRPWYEPITLWAGGALAIVALALLIRSLVPGIVGSPRGRTAPPPVAARVAGTADLFSDPPGATVRIDGVPLDGKTPLTGVSLEAGLHRVELDWGPYGVWRDTVEIAAGARLTIHPAVFGTVSFRSSDPKRVLDVFLDGVYAGTTPLRLDQVVVGRHLVRFAGPGVTASAQEVEVTRDGSVELVGDAGAAPAPGTLTVRSAILGEAGFEPGRGDPFWIDGAPRGVTPVTIQVEPGTHSVRVARRGFPPQISVLDVKAGGEHFATAEFGARSEEPLRFEPPPSLSLSQPTPLTISLPTSEWDPAVELWLYAAPPGGSFQARRMTPLEAGSRAFAALVPEEVLRASARRVRVYFKATGTAGREVYSEIHTIPVRD